MYFYNLIFSSIAYFKQISQIPQKSTKVHCALRFTSFPYDLESVDGMDELSLHFCSLDFQTLSWLDSIVFFFASPWLSMLPLMLLTHRSATLRTNLLFTLSASVLFLVIWEFSLFKLIMLNMTNVLCSLLSVCVHNIYPDEHHLFELRTLKPKNKNLKFFYPYDTNIQFSSRFQLFLLIHFLHLGGWFCIDIGSGRMVAGSLDWCYNAPICCGGLVLSTWCVECFFIVSI